MSPSLSAHHTSSLLRLLFASRLRRRTRARLRGSSGPGSLWSYRRRGVERDALRLEQRAAALRLDAFRLRHHRAVQKTQTRQLVEGAQAAMERERCNSNYEYCTRTRNREVGCTWNGMEQTRNQRTGSSGSRAGRIRSAHSRAPSRASPPAARGRADCREDSGM